jgi:hypothetical protein
LLSIHALQTTAKRTKFVQNRTFFVQKPSTAYVFAPFGAFFHATEGLATKNVRFSSLASFFAQILRLFPLRQRFAFFLKNKTILFKQPVAKGDKQ